MVGVEGYCVDQGIGAELKSPGQVTGSFAVKNDDLRTSLDEVVWQWTVATMGNSDAPAMLK
jgi:hypothetical protein